MATNVNFSKPNFCIAPRADEFCSIDHTAGVNGQMQLNTSAGVTIQTYNLDTSVNEIKSLEYTGPRGLVLGTDDFEEDLPFFTLERINAFQCKIRRWELSVNDTQLKLQDTITLNSVGSNYFDCEAMAVEHYETSFQTAVSSGTGIIEIASLDNIEVGDILLLGPSRADLNGSPPGNRKYEYVEVATISGGDVYITTSGINYDYADGDPICVWKNIYLFSDVGQINDSTRGSLYTIDPNDGTVLDVDNSGVYADVRAASWSRYNSYPAFVKESQLLYIDPSDYELKISHTLNNIKANRTSLWTIHDLVMDDINVYRLQSGRTDADDSGDLTDETSWSNYNYVNDFTTAYTRSVDVNIVNGILLNNELFPKTTNVKATVRDQYGNPRSGLANVYLYEPTNFGSFLTGNPHTTDSNGQISVTWEANDPALISNNIVDVRMEARAPFANTTVNGSDYYWGEMWMELHNRHSEDIYLDQISANVTSDVYFDQISDNFSTDAYFDQLGPFTIDIYSPQQLSRFNSDLQFDQIDNDFDIDIYFEQHKQKSNDLQLSQLFISTHESTGHQDTAIVTQFTFLYDFRPPPYSEKNSINTDIYAKIGPAGGFDLNQSTLKFKVREVSYAGDTGYVDVTSFSGTTINTWNTIGGDLGLEITYVPDQPFHYNAVVYVSIEVYDNATTPNIMLYDYWFKVTPDFRAPYIINEIPYREEEEVLPDTDISFDIIDPGVGVDIDSLELYINNRFVTPTTSGISGGYHISYNPSSDFHYGQTVEITVYAHDLSSTRNQLYDTWRFYCEGSTGPWIDRSSFYPRDCSRGVYRKVIGIMINVLGINDTGVDRDSLTMTIEDKERDVAITPIIYRID